MEIVVFEINQNRYAINVHDIDELLNMATFRSPPETPAFVAGVFNLRGQLLPVLDFAYFIGYNRAAPPPPLSQREPMLSPYPSATRLLLFSNTGQRMLLIIDAMQCVQEVDAVRIKPTVSKNSMNDSFLSGMLVEGERVIYLLDIKSLLRADELAQLAIEASL